jgi:hypothetical protein
MKMFEVTVPVHGTMMVLVEAENEEEAKEKTLRGEIADEDGAFQYGGIDENGEWAFEEAKALPERVEAIKVDLTWSLWSLYKDYWEEQAPGVWDKIEGLEVGKSIEIETAPRKEIRYGGVEISRTETGWQATGQFFAVWDEAEELAETVGVEEDRIDEVRKVLPVTWEGPGVDVDIEVEAPTLEELMRLIDKREDVLLEEEKEAWTKFERHFKDEP